jgi:hypothetical protein
VSSLPASTPDRSHLCLSEELSLHDVPHVTPIIGSFHPFSPVYVERHYSVATSFDWTQGPTDTPVISPTVNSNSVPLPALALSASTHHSLFSPPSSNTVNPQYNANLSIIPSIALLCSPAPARSTQQAVPASPHSSSALPAPRTAQA